MRVRYQGGSLAGFITIGVILTLVLIGSLYGLNRYNAEQSKEVATDQEHDAGEKSPARPEPKETPMPAKPKVADNEDKKNPQAQPESTAQSPLSNSQLPATGPADVIAAAISVVALSIATAYYAQSFSYKRR